VFKDLEQGEGMQNLIFPLNIGV